MKPVEREQPLPNDVLALKSIIAELTEKIELKDAKIAALQHNVHLLTKWAFAQKSERRPLGTEVDPAAFQGALLFPEILEAAERVADQMGAQGAVEIKPPADTPRDGSPARPVKKRGRRSEFPEDLPIVRTTFELPESDRRCACCGEDLKQIGEDVTRELERLELTVVHEIARAKYGCKNCAKGVKTAPGPDRVIEKGLLGVGFLAHMLAERFGNHMPYHRLEQKYRGEGLELSRSVLCESAKTSAGILKPIAIEIQKQVLASGYVQTDDTGVLMLEPRDDRGKRRPAAKCEMWTYRSPGNAVFYDFADPRKRDGPLEILRHYRGHLQADAHPCYEPLYKSGEIVEIACWAHARRRFIDAEAAEETLSREAVELIRRLYAIERRAKDEDLDADSRRRLRQSESVQILKAIDDWMTATKPKVLERGPLGVAISYAQKNWKALNRYVEDGKLEIDNNGAERALRSVAVGRKNWTFLGAETGGETASVMLTLVMSAKEAGVDPRMYLRDALLRIGRCSDVKSLTPKGWKERWLPQVQAHRQSIMERLFEQKQAVEFAQA